VTPVLANLVSIRLQQRDFGGWESSWPNNLLRRYVLRRCHLAAAYRRTEVPAKVAQSASHGLLQMWSATRAWPWTLVTGGHQPMRPKDIDPALDEI